MSEKVKKRKRKKGKRTKWIREIIKKKRKERKKKKIDFSTPICSSLIYPGQKQKSTKNGAAGNRTPDLSHAKGILYH